MILHLWAQKITTTTQQQWLYKLIGYDFQVEYKKGGENVVADALSRRYAVEDSTWTLLAFSQIIPYLLEVIKEEITIAPTLQELQQRIQQGEALVPWYLVDGIILFKGRMYLPTNSKLNTIIINELCGSTNERYVKTLQRIKANFYCKEMRKQIKDSYIAVILVNATSLFVYSHCGHFSHSHLK